MHETISEFESPLTTLAGENLGLYLLPIACLFIFVALVLFSIVPLWRKRRPAQVLLALVFVPLALAMVRNAPLLAIACTPGAAWALPFASLVRRVRLGGLAAGRLERAVLAGAALVAVSSASGRERCLLRGTRAPQARLRLEPLSRPGRRGRLAERAPLAGQMFNDLDFGGYLGFALRRPVSSTDGSR
jgi:hypothetical protein